MISSVIASKPVFPAHVPAELARICARAMHEDPGERFESVEALRLALQRYLEHRGSAELGVRAHERLDELRAALAAKPIDRETIYRLFGACRFGFHEALSVWRDNDEARAGLVRATIAVAEYELADDNPDSAVTLLTELDDPPALLARAREAAAARHERTAELEKLRAAHDTSIGRRTRTVVIAAFGLLFTIVPLVIGLRPSLVTLTYPMLVESSFAIMVALVAIRFWASSTLGATLFNRRIIATGIFVFAAQTLLTIGLRPTGASVEVAQSCMEFLWGVTVALMAIHIDVWFASAAVVYLASFMFTVHFPEYRMFAIAASNAVFMIVGIWRWRPDTFQMTPEERAWLDAQKGRSARNRAGARARSRPAADAPAPPSTDGSD